MKTRVQLKDDAGYPVHFRSFTESLLDSRRRRQGERSAAVGSSINGITTLLLAAVSEDKLPPATYLPLTEKRSCVPPPSSYTSVGVRKTSF